MATQMAVITGVGAFAGKKADEHFGNEKPLFTILGAVIGITAVLYLIIKDLTRTKP